MSTTRNTDNLQPFPPGVSGNPAGKPKHKPISDALRHMVQSAVIRRKQDGKKFIYVVELPKEPRAADYLAQGILEDALNRDKSAMNLLFERTEGKVPQPIAGSDDPSDPPIKTDGGMTVKEVARIFGNVLMNAEYDRLEKEEAAAKETTQE